MIAKNIQMKIEIPIPFALSLLKIAASIANEENIIERKTPVMSKDAPVSMEEYNKIGIPQPIKNANIKAVESPKKRLNQTLDLGTG